MCFWPFRKRKPAIKETAMTVESVIAVLRDRLSRYVARMEAEKAARDAKLIDQVVDITNMIPPEPFEPSNN